jgi:hypothetical protein
VNYSASLDRSFLALAHPVRRSIVERLTHGSATVGEATAVALGATVGEADGSASARAAASTTGVAAARVGAAVGIRAVCVETVLAKRSKKASGVAVASWTQPAPQRATGVARRPSSETTTTAGRPGETAAGGGGSAGAPTQPAPSSAARAPARNGRDDPMATPIGD